MLISVIRGHNFFFSLIRVILFKSVESSLLRNKKLEIELRCAIVAEAIRVILFKIREIFFSEILFKIREILFV